MVHPVRIRFATNRFLKGLGALGLALCLGVGQASTNEQTANLSLSEARGLAVYALNNEQPELALQVGRGLLQADARDPFAHYVMASAYAQMGRPAEGRGWLGITPREAYLTADVTVVPLVNAWLFLLAASALMVGAWLREGRR